jgi:tetratricopeptide (TPR) repeat protein
LYRDLADVLLAANRRPEAIKLLESTPFEILKRADIIIMLAQAYLNEQQYGKAVDLLESTPYFVNWEGQTITWDLFHKAHMERGQQRFDNKNFKGALHDFEAALTYPENIGVGRSNKPQEAKAQYWRGKALQALERFDDARLAFEEGAAGHEGSKEQNKYRELCKKALSR